MLYLEQLKQLAAVITRLKKNDSQSDILEQIEQIVVRNDELGKMAEVFLKINKRFKANYFFCLVIFFSL